MNRFLFYLTGFVAGGLISFLVFPTDAIPRTEYETLLQQLYSCTRTIGELKGEVQAREEDLDNLLATRDEEKERTDNTLVSLIAERDLAVNLLKSFGTTPQLEPTTTTVK